MTEQAVPSWTLRILYIGWLFSGKFMLTSLHLMSRYNSKLEYLHLDVKWVSGYQSTGPTDWQGNFSYFIDYIVLLAESEQSGAGLVRLVLFYFLLCWTFLGHTVIDWRKFSIFDFHVRYLHRNDNLFWPDTVSEISDIFKRRRKKVNEIFHLRIEWKNNRPKNRWSRPKLKISLHSLDHLEAF